MTDEEVIALERGLTWLVRTFAIYALIGIFMGAVSCFMTRHSPNRDVGCAYAIIGYMVWWPVMLWATVQYTLTHE